MSYSMNCSTGSPTKPMAVVAVFHGIQRRDVSLGRRNQHSGRLFCAREHLLLGLERGKIGMLKIHVGNARLSLEQAPLGKLLI